MTKVILNINSENNIMFDCLNHAGDPAVCRAVSALCGVLTIETARLDSEPTIYTEGHVRIDLFNASETTITIFNEVFEVFKQLAEQNPENVRIY